jgi:hypothetical protein
LLELAVIFAAAALGQQQPVGDQIVDPLELATHADRPGHRRHVEREHVGNLVERLEHLPAFAIDLVDEGDDRHRAQAADFEQFARLRLDALGGVDHHHCRIDCGQGAIGILGKVLMARRVEQVEGDSLALERHHRAGHRNAALLLDLHPVRAGTAGLPTRLHLAGEMDRAAEQQELFGQRGLAGIGVRNDREGTSIVGRHAAL